MHARKVGAFDDPAILGWIEARLLRPLSGFGDGPIDYRFPVLGTRTPIAIARAEGGAQAVVKLMRSAYALFRVSSNQRWMQDHGLPVPRVLAWSARSRVAAPRHFVMVDQFIDGPAINEVADPGQRAGNLERIATSLAAMHSHARRRAGPVWLASPVPALKRYLPRVLERVDKLRPTVGDAAVAELRGQVLEQAGRLGGRDRHELIHGHVNPNNFLLADGTAWIIDLEMVQFGDFGRDLVRAAHRLARGDAEHRRRFLERYFEAVQGVTREDWRAQAPFYEADYRLARAGGWQRDHAAGELDRDAFEAKVDEDLGAARAALSGSWTPD